MRDGQGGRQEEGKSKGGKGGREEWEDWLWERRARGGTEGKGIK